ncbi:MAG: hypothetical protein ACE37H_09610 [Phycisphaeraceae bacterium]
MTDLKKLLLIPMIAGSLALTGCGGGDDHDDHDDHDHEEHSEGDGHDHDKEGGDEHGAEHGLGEITIAGSVLEVAVGGEPEPNATLHIDLELKSGPKPSAIRVWVSDDSGKVLTSKGKAMGSGDYHADATCPAELPDNAMLWIEVEPAQGEREAKPLALK